MMLWMMAACGPASSPVVVDPTDPAIPTVVDCGISVSSVFPSDGATGVFISPFYDQPRVVGPADVLYRIVDAEGDSTFYPDFEARNAGWEPDLGLGSAGPRAATLRIQATDTEGCTQVLSTFTTGPWGRIESAFYDGMAVALDLPASDVALIGSVLGGDHLNSGFLFAPTGSTEGWGAIPIDDGEPDVCWPTPVVPNARMANGVLFITGMTGTIAGDASFEIGWEGVSIDALVDPETGDWARVRLSGTLRTPMGICTNADGCPPCPDDAGSSCIEVDFEDGSGHAFPFDWTFREEPATECF